MPYLRKFSPVGTAPGNSAWSAHTTHFAPLGLRGRSALLRTTGQKWPCAPGVLPACGKAWSASRAGRPTDHFGLGADFPGVPSLRSGNRFAEARKKAARSCGLDLSLCIAGAIPRGPWSPSAKRLPERVRGRGVSPPGLRVGAWAPQSLGRLTLAGSPLTSIPSPGAGDSPAGRPASPIGCYAAP